MERRWKLRLTGLAAGVINGFFGGGGGMAAVPLLNRWCSLDQRRTFANCVALILPLCAVSAAVCWWRGTLDWALAWPYLAGGAVGGLIGGKLFGRVPIKWLRRIFAVFLLYGGVRYLL